MRERKRKGTQTSSFGVSKRESHDSSRFYNSRLYKDVVPIEKLECIENKIDERYLNKVFCKSSEKMDELPDCSVHLMVTSPPYNVGKEYDENLTLEQYRQLLKTVFTEVFRVLIVGGRACVNVANIGRKPYIPLHSYIIQDMLDIGFLMRGEILWDKSASSGTSTAWGSWKSAINPTLRDVHEYIMVFSKTNFSRNGFERKTTITSKEFLEFTKSIWTFPTESAKRVRHPAPFPVELPYRLIQLYTFEGDVILDPFMGSGTTAVASLRTNRYFIGYDNEKEYVSIANRRIHNELNEIKVKKEQARLDKFALAEDS
jgi:site-specific DNA-methyltransferase (adenine-specific)